jgi:Flp pilus assembly protein TadD
MLSKILIVIGMIGAGTGLAFAGSPASALSDAHDAPAKKASSPARKLRAPQSPEKKPATMKEALAENAALNERLNSVADDLAKRSDVYWHKGDFESVAYLLRKVVELDPSDVGTWSQLGWIEWACLNDEKAAEKTLREGLALNPHQSALYEELGNYLNRRKRFGEAAASLSKAVQFKDADALTWNSYAHALEGMKRYDQAAAAWTKMEKLFPGNPHSMVNLDRMKRKGEIE